MTETLFFTQTKNNLNKQATGISTIFATGFGDFYRQVIVLDAVLSDLDLLRIDDSLLAQGITLISIFMTLFSWHRGIPYPRGEYHRCRVDRG